MVKDRILKLEKIDWNKLHSLQPDNIKSSFYRERLRHSINKYGIARPFAVWESEGVIYSIDGHQRKDELNKMIASGVKIPKKLSAYFIDAKDKEEAIKILLEVFNQETSQMDEAVLNEWLQQVEDFDTTDIDFDVLDVKVDYAFKGKNYDGLDQLSKLDKFMGAELKRLFLVFSSGEFNNVVEWFKMLREKHSVDDNSSVILKLMENENL
jgi:hypothetical protein